MELILRYADALGRAYGWAHMSALRAAGLAFGRRPDQDFQRAGLRDAVQVLAQWSYDDGYRVRLRRALAAGIRAGKSACRKTSTYEAKTRGC